MQGRGQKPPSRDPCHSLLHMQGPLAEARTRQLPRHAETLPDTGTIPDHRRWAMGLASNAPLLAAWAADRLLKSSRPANLTAFARFIGTYQPDNNQPVSTVNKRGHDVLHDPLVNKGTGFPHSERERLGLRGLLPHKQLNVNTRLERWLDEYKFGKDYIDPGEVEDGGLTHDHCRKWKSLQELQDRNEQMFYHVLLQNFVEMAPIVYTPTVGWACLNYHKLYRRPRGMYFSAEDKGEMAAMVHNWPGEVNAIVVTDGARILGLGDLGLNGMGIPIGKLDLYIAAAGFHPRRILPCVIDVGTDNQALRADKVYMGLDQPRLQGPEYVEIIDEFVKAVMGRWPDAVLQFEDFNMANAQPLLQRYRHSHLVFNDDIQGTAATACAGVYGALEIQDRPLSDITKQRFVMVGAGSAGMGVTTMLSLGMRKYGLSPEEARAAFWVIDKDGLITTQRSHLSEYVQPFARTDPSERDGEDLLSLVKRVKPTVLVGLSGVGRLFTDGVLTEMGRNNERPIIMPMSNPVTNMECSHSRAQRFTGGRAIFASGSPQPDVDFEGKHLIASQANNMYIFPGLAMGAHLGQTGIITDTMLTAASEALPALIPARSKERGCVYPPLDDIRNISKCIARDVIKTAASEGRVQNRSVLRRLAQGDQALEDYIAAKMYTPNYDSLIYLPPGESRGECAMG